MYDRAAITKFRPPAAPLRPRCATGSLGGLADAMRVAPVATMMTTGVVMGGLWGAALGWIGSRLMKRDPARWTVGGAVAGAAVLGSVAYVSGAEMERWLARQTP